MKKITLLFFFALFSWLGHSQLAQEDFDGTGWSLGATTDWWAYQNSVSLSQQWKQSNPLNPSVEIPYDAVNTPPQGNCAFVNQQNGPDGGIVPQDWLVTPIFEVPANGQLKFMSRLGFTGNQGGVYKILITEDVDGDLSDLTIYQDVIQWTEPVLNPNQTTYMQKIVNLPLALVGSDVRIAFYMEGDQGDRWMVDNVSVVEQCLPPTGLGVTAVTASGATLTWVGSPTGQYEVEWMPASQAPTMTPNLPTVTGTSVVLPGLSPTTAYKFYVRAVCGPGDFSEWTLPYTFSTPPSNDDCANAISLTVNPTNICTVTTLGTVQSASGSADGGDSCGGVEDDDVWFTFEATNTTHLISFENITGSTTDLNHVVYSGGCGSLTQVSCYTANNSTVTGLTVGEIYTLRVYSASASPQTTVFNVCIGTPPPPPANDECENAIVVPVNDDLSCALFVTGTVYSATASSQATTCTGTEDDDIWFSFVATSTTHTINRNNVTGGTTSIYHSVYSGTCDAPSQMYCSTTATSIAGGLTIGETYYIRFYSWATTPQTSVFDVCIGTPPPPPVNDECVNATAVTVNPDLECTSVTPGTVAWASASSQDQATCTGTEDDDVWFSFVATASSHSIDVINITGGTTLLYHTVYSGNCGTLTNMYCSTTNASLAGGLTIGETYFVRIYSSSTIPQASVFDVCIGTPPPPPVNDECANAITVLTNPDLTCANFATGTVAWATGSSEGDTTCSGTEDDDVWYQFVATSTAHVVTLNNIEGSTTLLYHTTYAGGDCDTFTQISCNTSNASLLSGLTIGATYSVRVYTSSALSQDTTFEICVGTPPPPPVNDECANAVSVTVNPALECTNVTPGTINYATGSAETTTCSGTEDDDVWFEFVATNTIHTISLLNIDGTALYHTVYEGDICGSLSQLYCDTNAESVADGLTIGETYKIRVYTFTATALQLSTFDVCVGTPPPPPVNDDCANAIEAPVNAGEDCADIVTGTISWATESPEATTCAGTEDDDVWFEFTATSTKHRIQILNAEGSTTLLYHTVYSGDVCGTLTQMYCSTAASSFAEDLTIGNTYKVRVYSSSSILWQTATFDFCVTTPPPPPANDDCAGATEVQVNAGQECVLTTPGTIYSATASDDATTCTGTEDDDVWFEFTATGPIHRIEILNIVNGTTTLYHSVYSGDVCGSLTQMYCSTASSSFAEDLTAGNVYKIRVYSSTATVNQTSDFDVCVTTPPPPPVNDECANAIVVTANDGAECIEFGTGTIYSATESAEPNTCTGTDDDDVWFEFTALETTHFINTKIVEGTGILYHAVYSGDCTALTQIDCSTTSGNLIEGLTVGTTYKVRVYSSTATANQTASFEICIGSPAQSITVDETTFTAEQLVENVLFSSPCAQISNVTTITGTNFGQTNGIGYFSANPEDFAFQDGVILATTSVQAATYPSGPAGTQSNIWLGDDDLEAIISVGGNTDGTNNATILEFDFMAYTDEFTFDFLFASDEYGTFQCSYSDAFAFILTDLSTGISQNLAVIPGTTTPISVVTIRDDAYNASCDDQNVEYFDKYYTTNTYANAQGFNGITVPFTAIGEVVPGNQYHIKFVIADYRDSSFNSAVFLGGGSFDVGDLDLGDDLTIIDETAICDTESATLTVDLESAELFEFEWLLDSTPETLDDVPVVIPGETEPTIVVTEPGMYYVRATFGDSDCSLEGDILVEMYAPIDMGDPLDLTACDASGFHEFDMAPNADLILAGIDTTEYDLADFTVTFHASQADAESGDNPIGPVYTNTVEDLQPIFVRIVYEPTGCPTYKEFDLIVQDLTPEFEMPEDFNICVGTTDATITIVPGTNFPSTPDVTISWTHDGVPLTETGVTVPVTGPGVYEVTVNNSGCESVDSVTVTETPIPVPDEIEDADACDVYILPALSANNRYFTGPDATGEELFAGEEINADATIYVYAESNTLPANCVAQSDFVVNISPSPTFSLGGPYIECDASNVIIQVQEDANFDIATATYEWTVNGNPVTGDYEIQGTEFGTYTLTVTTADGCTSVPVSVVVTQDTTVVDLNPTHGCDGFEYKVNVDPVVDADGNESYDPDTVLISWTGPNGFSSSDASAVITDEGVYTVTVTTDQGCIGEESVTVENTGCMIPRGISPNGDTLNDNFDLTGFDVSKLSIFNRYGREVYSKTNYKDEWFGQTNGGDELPTGTYFYAIEHDNGESKTGWVYINRQEN